MTRQGRITTFFGRTKYFKEILDPEITSRKKASLIRQANNLPVQGTAADYLKLAETKLRCVHQEQGLGQTHGQRVSSGARRTLYPR